ncbi:MAG: patatin-like phospholipase family protein [Sulfobacillus sp.]|nr:patatin-like phospholipase family protein [Sulfobacillus sp.]
MDIAIALSGGGLLGAAHLGALKALEEAGYRPRWVAGTSAGGLIAGMMSLHVSVDDLIQFGQAVSDHPERYFGADWRGLADDLWPRLGPPATGLVNPDRFIQALLALAPIRQPRLEDWYLPTALTAVDIAQILSVAFVAHSEAKPEGHWTVFRRVPVELALKATMAMPGLFTAPRWENHLFVDGGLADTLPADWAYAISGHQPVLAVNVATLVPQSPDHLGMGEILSRSEEYATNELSRLRARRLPVFTVAPNTRHIPFFGFRDYRRLIAIGYAAVRAELPDIRRFFDPAGQSPPTG